MRAHTHTYAFYIYIYKCIMHIPRVLDKKNKKIHPSTSRTRLINRRDIKRNSFETEIRRRIITAITTASVTDRRDCRVK